MPQPYYIIVHPSCTQPNPCSETRVLLYAWRLGGWADRLTDRPLLSSRVVSSLTNGCRCVMLAPAVIRRLGRPAVDRRPVVSHPRVEKEQIGDVLGRDTPLPRECSLADAETTRRLLLLLLLLSPAVQSRENDDALSSSPLFLRMRIFLPISVERGAGHSCQRVERRDGPGRLSLSLIGVIRLFVLTRSDPTVITSQHMFNIHCQTDRSPSV